MATSVWNRCVTAAAKCFSPSFSGESLSYLATMKFCFYPNIILCLTSICLPSAVVIPILLAVRAKCPKFLLSANYKSTTLILPENPRLQLTVLRLTRLKMIILAWIQPIVTFIYITCLTVFTARRWLLSAAYTDTKLWETRERDPQNIGES